MRVKMLTEIQGLFVDSDGSHIVLPRPGNEVSLPVEMARDLIRLGHAIEARAKGAKAVTADPDPVVPAPDENVSPVTESALTTDPPAAG